MPSRNTDDILGAIVGLVLSDNDGEAESALRKLRIIAKRGGTTGGEVRDRFETVWKLAKGDRTSEQLRSELAALRIELMNVKSKLSDSENENRRLGEAIRELKRLNAELTQRLDEGVPTLSLNSRRVSRAFTMILFLGVLSIGFLATINDENQTSREAQSILAGSAPVVLRCTLSNGRVLEAIVLLPHLHKLRVWYGDGGGEEWTDVDMSRPVIETNKDHRVSLALSDNLRHLDFDSVDGAPGGEHAFGDCARTVLPAHDSRLIDAKLRQPWE